MRHLRARQRGLRLLARGNHQLAYVERPSGRCTREMGPRKRPSSAFGAFSPRAGRRNACMRHLRVRQRGLRLLARGNHQLAYAERPSDRCGGGMGPRKRPSSAFGAFSPRAGRRNACMRQLRARQRGLRLLARGNHQLAYVERPSGRCAGGMGPRKRSSSAFGAFSPRAGRRNACMRHLRARQRGLRLLARGNHQLAYVERPSGRCGGGMGPRKRSSSAFGAFSPRAGRRKSSIRRPASRNGNGERDRQPQPSAFSAGTYS